MTSIKEKMLAILVFIGMAAAFLGMSALFPEYPEAAAVEPNVQDKPTDERYKAEKACFPGLTTTDDRMMGGMPCEDPETFQRWYVTYNAMNALEDGNEQATSEEAGIENAKKTETGNNNVHTESPQLETKEDIPATLTMETEIESPEEGRTAIPHYTVDGHMLSSYLQDYLYHRLQSFGMEWFYETSLCQIYQESRYRSWITAENGVDMGLCQHRVTYFQDIAREAGLYEADIFNPIDSIYVYTYLMDQYYRETGDVPTALSLYFTGPDGAYNAQYVHDVMQWQPMLEATK